MSNTFDLYYDPDCKDPWSIAASGGRVYGEPVVKHITDNGWDITGEETDEELDEFAALLTADYGMEITDDDDEEPCRLPDDVALAGCVKMLRFCRDARREETENA